MKKCTSLLLALALLLTMTACQNVPDATDPPEQPSSSSSTTVPSTEPSTSEQPVTAEPLVYDLPLAAITVTEQTEAGVNSDGITIFEYHYQNVWLHLPDTDMAEAVTLDLLNRIDETRIAADSIHASAMSDNPDYPYSLTVLYEPARIDTGLLSLSGVLTSYNGGNQAATSCMGITYDLTTGSILTLDDILVDGTTADVICRLTVDALGEIAESVNLFSDYSATVEERFAGNFLLDEGWYLSAEGLCFDFMPYEIAPNSAGVVTAVIGYDRLTGVLEDAYFPMEQVTADGVMSVTPFAEADLNRFSQFAEVILDSDGSTYLLYTDGLIYDISIETGRWNPYAQRFTPSITVFAAANLVPGNAILLQTNADTAIRVTYTRGDGTTQFCVLSGEIID